MMVDENARIAGSEMTVVWLLLVFVNRNKWRLMVLLAAGLAARFGCVSYM